MAAKAYMLHLRQRLGQNGVVEVLGSVYADHQAVVHVIVLGKKLQVSVQDLYANHKCVSDARVAPC